jgi:hypothetical protein
VEATQVGDDQHFAHLLEQRLGGSPVLPVGVSSYSVADYIVKAPAFKKLFQPDWVIIPVRAASFGTNAWNSNKGGGYAFFTRMNHASQTTTPDFQLNAEAAVADGSVQVFSVPLSKPGWLSSMIRTKCPFWYPLLDFTYLRKAEMEAWIAGHDRPWFHGAVGAPNVDQQTVDETKGYPLKKEMKLLAKAYDGRLTLLFLPKFDPRDPAKEMESEKTLHRLADKAGVRFVSLREKFPALAEAGHAPYGFGNTRFNSGHWNCYAHEAAADLLFEELRQLDSLRKLAASIADAPKRIDLPEAREISVLSPQRTEGLE